jgi:heptosyltransferase-2
VTKPRGKILVIRGGAIGDFILTLPVFSALRQQFPQTRLDVLAYPHIAQLALVGGLVDEVRAIDREHWLVSSPTARSIPTR